MSVVSWLRSARGCQTLRRQGPSRNTKGRAFSKAGGCIITTSPCPDSRALRLTGTVSLERNGGFLQVARALHGAARPCLDASAFSGIALTVCGTQGTYFIHLRTTDTRAPWQHCSAVLPVTTTWQDVVLTWNDFSPRKLNAPLAPQCLTRIGLVAAQSAFNADLAVSRIAFVQAHCRQRTNLRHRGSPYR